ncbi:MAG: tetratricopeptide repeat protein [Phycisphaeraceae bacterium]|nr:tetratricopeptide repeat protein [Phycisphaeraceae bacterium]
MQQATARFMMCWLTAVMTLTAVGCRTTGRDTSPALPPTSLRSPIQIPPGIEASLLTALTGDALTKARTPTEQVLAALPVPQELANPAPVSDREPPLAAQQAYIHGRAALQTGDRTLAITELEKVLKLAPDSAAAMRLLGGIYATSNEPTKSAGYFSDAVRHDPRHAASLYVLARFALEQSDWPRGAALMHQAINCDTQSSDDTDAASGLTSGGGGGGEADTATPTLACYYLGLALARMGYLQPAVEQFHAFLDGQSNIRGPQGVVRELLLLRQQDPLTWQTIGDLYLQLDQPRAALQAYTTAAAMTGDNVVLFDLSPRLVYAQLRLAQAQAAVDAVLADVRRSHGGEQSLDMVKYLADQGVDRTYLADALTRIIQQDDEADATAIIIAQADLYDPPRAERRLLAHLKDHGDQIGVFDRLLTFWLADVSDERTLPAAIEGTADLMAEHPDEAETYALMLFRRVNDTEAMNAAVNRLTPQRRAQPMVQVIEGLALADLGQIEEAQHTFEQALDQQPDVLVARLQLIRLKVMLQQYDDAAGLLEPIGESDDPSVVGLRVRVLTETGHSDEALKLLDKLIVSGHADPTLILQKARLQLQQGNVNAAQYTLQEALNQHPQNESLYEALFQLYDARNQAGQPLIGDVGVQYRLLLRQLLTEIPDTRIGRLKRAELHAAGREYGQAIALLSSLSDEDHRDLPVLKKLLEVMVAAQQSDQAVQLMDKRVAENNRDGALLRLAISFYGTVGDQQRATDVQERLLDMLPEGDNKLLGQAALYLTTDRAPQALTMLENALRDGSTQNPLPLIMLLTRARLMLQQADRIDEDYKLVIEKYPQQEADLRYRWATSHAMRGDQDAYLAALIQTHEKFPDHPATNNDLGYLWLEKNQNLQQALDMIHKAVDAQPTNAAYMDSLGWAYYKLGKYDDAVTWLRQAEQQTQADLGRGGELGEALSTRVVVLDHLGDALYRSSDADSANQSWRQAQRVLANLPVSEGDELDKIRVSLAAKVEAFRNQLPIPGFPSGGAPGSEAAPAPEEGNPNDQTRNSK